MSRMNWDRARQGAIGRYYPPGGESRLVDLYSDGGGRRLASEAATQRQRRIDPSKRYGCPECETRGTYASNLRRHLMGRRPAGHAYTRAEADAAIELIERGELR